MCIVSPWYGQLMLSVKQKNSLANYTVFFSPQIPIRIWCCSVLHLVFLYIYFQTRYSSYQRTTPSQQCFPLRKCTRRIHNRNSWFQVEGKNRARWRSAPSLHFSSILSVIALCLSDWATIFSLRCVCVWRDGLDPLRR